MSEPGSPKEWGVGYRLRDAAVLGDIAAVESLLDSGVDPDSMSSQIHGLFRPWVHGRPALWHAAAQGNLELLKLLLSRGANPNLVGWISSTPLWTACCLGHVEIVACLLAAGADPNLAGARNTKPLAAWMGVRALPAWAQGQSVSCEIGDLLQRAGAELNEVEEILAAARLQMKQVGYPEDRLDQVRQLQMFQAQQQAVELDEAVIDVDQQSGTRRL